MAASHEETAGLQSTSEFEHWMPWKSQQTHRASGTFKNTFLSTFGL